MNNGIRVTYSGLISFAVGITSVLTGIIFTLIVTRTLSPEDFGTWNLIGGLITYVLVVEPIISYWATREIARGLESGRTAVLSSGIFSIGGTLVYLLIAYSLATHLHANQNVLLFAAILVPVMFLNKTLTAVNLGWKPQSSSYGILCFEISKIPAALIFVYFLHMSIFGAIISTCIAYVASIVILLFYARDRIRSKIKMEFLKKWIKLSWLSIYPGISVVVYHLDVVIFSAMTGSVVGLAFYSVSQTISNVVGNSSLIAQAVYSKLLESGKREHLQENLVRFFYFAFPLAALSIVFARPALFALNPIYEIAVPAVIFMTIRAFLYVLGGIFSQALLGIETVDINEQSRFRDFVKSKLFFVPTVILIQYTSYVIALTVGLLLLKSIITSNIDFVNYWTAISLVTQIPFTLYFYLKVRKHFTLSGNRYVLFKYLISSIASFGMIYFLLTYFLSYKRSIFEFIPSLLLFVGIGIGAYLVITYLIDTKTRDLFKSIIREIQGKSS